MRRLFADFGIVWIAILLWSALAPGQMAPSAPSAAAATGIRKHQAKLNWKAPSGKGAVQPNSYIIYRTDASIKDRVLNCGKKWRPIGRTAANVTEYTDEQVKPGKVYCYAVSAITSRGESSKSFAASAVIPSP